MPENETQLKYFTLNSCVSFSISFARFILFSLQLHKKFGDEEAPLLWNDSRVSDVYVLLSLGPTFE